VDPFVIATVVTVAVAILGTCVAARAGRGKPLAEFGVRRHREHRGFLRDDVLEAEDLREMLAVTNERRRARGLPERSIADAYREFGGD
jgi:hypothetical protein